MQNIKILISSIFICITFTACSTTPTVEPEKIVATNTIVPALDDLNHPRCGVGW